MSNVPKFIYVNTNKPTAMLTTSFEKDNLYKAYEKPQDSLEPYINVNFLNEVIEECLLKNDMSKLLEILN